MVINKNLTYMVPCIKKYHFGYSKPPQYALLNNIFARANKTKQQRTCCKYSTLMLDDY